MSTQRFDFFLMTAEITFQRGDDIKQRRVNTVLQLPKPVVDYQSIDDARIATFERLQAEGQIEPQMIKDFVILSISHLGRCTPAEFHKGSDAVRVKPITNH